jgi:hypothetical protein
MMDNAESRRQKTEGVRGGRLARVVCFFALAGCLVGLISMVGCADRVSPAAVPTQAASRQAESVSKTSDQKAADLAATDKVAAADHSAAAAKPVVSGPVRDIPFDAIKFNIEKDQPFVRSMITPTIEKLTDSKIRIRGYMLPSFQQSGLTQFVLVRDNMQCCFGPGAALYDCIVVQMDSGKTTDFTTQPVAVEGVFSIDVLKSPEDKCLAVYHLQAERVR